MEKSNFKIRCTKAILKRQYSKGGERKLKELEEMRKKPRKEAEEILAESETTEDEDELLPGNESGPMRTCEKGLSVEELHVLWEKENNFWSEVPVQTRRNLVKAVPPKENNIWREVPVQRRRNLVEAVPPKKVLIEDEPLTEEEQRLKVLLENFHLTEPTPHINRQQQDADMMRDHLKRHRPN